MEPAPKRSLGDTIVQLVVIAILIGILIGAVILLRDYVHSHNASDPPSTSIKATYNFTCCTVLKANVIYHPGEIVRLAWTPVKSLPGVFPTRTITLSATLSKSFPSIRALKSSAKSGVYNVKVGPFIAAAHPLRVSNRSGVAPVLRLRIPVNARTGYYTLETRESQKNFSVGGGTIIEIHR
jgi:hypothetical protein